ncbi:MAG: hypothetical protein HKO87_09770 [Acidimicrobiia bacterium]|nr:hypothetical protein [Acidimicrobiia bacterium]NNK92707.1 hypothetical protein [Acidimicrobiia bacterium]
MRRRLVAIITAAVLVLSLAGVASATPRTGGEHKVTVCHATSSATNPWVIITVDVASTQHRAHDNHVHKDGREDIIYDMVMPDLLPEECANPTGDPGGDDPDGGVGGVSDDFWLEG